MARRTRGTESKKPLGPLSAASERLQALALSGITPEKRGETLRKSVEVAESIRDNPNADPFARMAAVKFLAVVVAGVAPPKAAAQAPAPQGPVIIALPDYARPAAPKELPAGAVQVRDNSGQWHNADQAGR